MATTAIEPNATSIEALFRPTTRFRGRLPHGFTELELLPGLTVENVRATGVSWEGFRRFLQGKLVWMSPDVYICSQYFSGLGESVLSFGSDVGRTDLRVHVRSRMAAAAAMATCDFLLRLLATCEIPSVYIIGLSNSMSLPVSGAGLSLFFQESQSCLRQVTFRYVALSEDQCRALATMSRLDVKLELWVCSLSSDAEVAFVECLKSDRGPITLNQCDIDGQILARALTGRSRVTSLRLVPLNRIADDAGMGPLFTALANNRGLVDLELRECSISNENLAILCQSLQAHPTLTSLHLVTTRPTLRPGGRISLVNNQKKHRTRMLADMMQRNTSVHTVTLSGKESDQKIYMADILPLLETNRYRPRVLAVKKTKDKPFREKVLGRALDSVKTDPNLLWMFLSENVDAFARSKEEEETNSIAVPVKVATAEVVVVVAVADGIGSRLRSKRKR
jgi:hypothetical protein